MMRSTLKRGAPSVKGRGRMASAAALAIGLAGCGSDALDTSEREPPPDPFAFDPSERGSSGRWIESFDHREQLGALEGDAILDSNQGRLLLPAVAMPGHAPEGEVELAPSDGRLGLVQADEVVVPAGVRLEVPDALEIQGGSRVRIDGEIVAGAGGVVVTAEHAITIGGEITALGPIELLIRSPEGRLVVEGTLLARGSGPDAGPARVELGGRGGVEIRGQVRADEIRIGDEVAPPRIGVHAYGPILVGPEASLAAGPGGTIDLGTNDRIAIEDGAQLSDPATWTLEAEAIEVRPDARLDLGGGVRMIAEGRLAVGAGAEIRAGGQGAQILAGEVALGAGARVLGGGDAASIAPARVRLDAGTRLEAEEGARAETLVPSCAPDVPVEVRVAGPYVGLGRAAFRGAAPDLSCPGPSPVRVRLTAHGFEGVPPEVPAEGPLAGEVRVDPELALAIPPTTARIAGRWTSRPFARGAGLPRLTELDRSVPPGTEVAVALGVADGPEAPGRSFLPWSAETSEAWSVHADAPWLVVRIELAGRRFDAPAVDHVVVDRGLR